MQELTSADKEDLGRIPRTIEVDLLEDLVGTCAAGANVTIVGIVKVISTNGMPTINFTASLINFAFTSTV